MNEKAAILKYIKYVPLEKPSVLKILSIENEISGQFMNATGRIRQGALSVVQKNMIAFNSQR